MTHPPTIAQLHNLADRAAAGLTPDEQQRLRDGINRLAEYENTINWMTTCTGCARVLDSCIRETERAERAEAALARVRALHSNGYGLCDECTGSHGVPWPCPTIRALDQPSPAATQATEPYPAIGLINTPKEN